MDAYLKIKKRENDVLQVEAIYPTSAIKREKQNFLVSIEELTAILAKMRYAFRSEIEEVGPAFLEDISKLDPRGRKIRTIPGRKSALKGTALVVSAAKHLLVIDVSGEFNGEHLVGRYFISDSHFLDFLIKKGITLTLAKDKYEWLYRKKIR